MPFKCCVAFCSSNERHLHLFPKEPELFKQWCIVIGRSELLQKDFNLIRRSYRVCDVHFSTDQKFAANRNRTSLIHGALPSLCLPEAHTTSKPAMEGEPIPEPDLQESNAVPPLSSQPESVSRKRRRDDLTFKPVMEGEVPPEPDLQKSNAVPPLSPQPESVSRKRRRDDFTFKPLMEGEAPPEPDLQESNPRLPRFSTKPISRKRRRENFILSVNLKKKAELTPKAAQLYEFARKYRILSQRLQEEKITNKERIRAAEHHANTGELFRNKVNPETFRFLQSQIKEQPKSARGRRFSEEDKLLSLSLLKQSSRGYKLLRKIFALPSRRTLMRVLSSVSFNCGLDNSAVIASLKESVQKLNEKDRHCILMFDEMSIQPALFYDKTDESFVGFEDHGEDCEDGGIPKFADHAMTFMLRGLRKPWKQPISYYFSLNGMSNAAIAKHLKIAISKLLEIGFIVDATVNDQYNKSAINMLVQDTKRAAVQIGHRHETYSFKIDGKEILPLFDFPHLLKGIRNNMLNYDINFKWRNGPETASWEHIENTYQLDDNADEDFRMLNKLTEEHVNRAKIKKMKVKVAAQVFSQRVQSAIRAVLKFGNRLLPPEALGTANFLLFIDKLFDSVNGSAVNPKDGKLLRRAVTDQTEHCTFWDEAIAVLGTIKFIRNDKNYVPPTVTNWIESIRNLKALWNSLQKSGFEFLLPRSCNQDPIENFFGCIRSHGVRDINPTCKAFQSSFKTLIINNFTAYHSPSANCEDDEGVGALDSLRSFLDCKTVTNAEVSLRYADGKTADLKAIKDMILINVHGHLAGFVAKKILQKVGNCDVCRKELLATKTGEEHVLIKNLAYKSKALIRPRTKFITLFGLCVQICRQWLPKIAKQKRLATKLSLIITANINEVIFCKCKEHNLFKEFTGIFVNFYLFSYANTINNILKCKSQLHRLDFNDPLKKQAYKLGRKHKIVARNIRQIKLLQM